MSTALLVSVVMATWNDDPEYLAEAIASIAAQTYRNWELIIVDDSTRPETLRELDSLRASLGERCRLLRNDPPLGLARSLNAGFDLSRGELIARMDADDVCVPDRFEAQVSFLAAHPEIGIVGGDIEIVAQDLRHLSFRHYRKDPRELVRMSFIRNPLAQPTVMLRKSVLKKVGGYDPKCERAEDYELWLRAIKNSIGITNMDKVLIKYRVSDEYSKKRDKRNWKFGIYGKMKNFNFRYPFLSALGILLSIALRLAPASLVDRLYRRDYETPLLYRE
jgi:glycosyltransferase involved in cell wall biosynthesis